MTRRRLPWGIITSEMKTMRAARPDVREERLRIPSGSRGAGGLALSAWRGRSGRRYVVGVHDFETAAADPDHVVGAVAIAVRRDDHGLGHIVLVGREQLTPRWWKRARAGGATELHVHRLAEGADERAALAVDLIA